MRLTLSVLLSFLLIVSCKTNQKSTEKVGDGLFSLFVEDPNVEPFFSDREGVIGKNGMVASAHPEASKVGVEIMKKGGNAIDAAIATHFALVVVHPFAGNLGGGGFAVIRTKDGKAYTLDFREKAPITADRDMYLDENGNVIEGLSTLGHLASGVPGSVDGMVELHEKFGSLLWQTLLQPAIDLAEKGVILTEREALGLKNYKKTFQEVNGENKRGQYLERVIVAGKFVPQENEMWTYRTRSERGEDDEDQEEEKREKHSTA
ncbi:MAG: gamma-glutamyltransferase, partial [Spirosomaceae bacterium]|nr:gamma-glutamyltransferase [Spirosomataceae bacterium]